MLNDKKVESQVRACAEALRLVLWQVFAQGRPADRALAAFLRGHREYGARDRRILSGTVFGALRWWGWFKDYAPAKFMEAATAEKPADEPPKLPTAAWAALMLAARLMDDTGRPHSICWVCTKYLKLNRKGLDNWKVVEDQVVRAARIAALIRPEAKRPQLAFEDLIPEWSRKRIVSPRPLNDLVTWLQRRAPLWVRLQTSKPEEVFGELLQSELEPTAHPVLANAVSLGNPRVNAYTLDSYRKGAFEIQDLASQVIGHVCAPTKGSRWWDACAGAGGKALLLADRMGRAGEVVASDIRGYKLDDLRKRAKRSGFPNIRTRSWSGNMVEPASAKFAKFDGVLVDAPCTCSGTWRRNPDARWSTKPGDIAEMAALQKQILENACGAVKPGGTLVYATCSMFDTENRQVVKAFLADHPEFELTPFANPLTGKGTDGCLQVWPWDGDCDAMFVARFRRKK